DPSVADKTAAGRADGYESAEERPKSSRAVASATGSAALRRRVGSSSSREATARAKSDTRSRSASVRPCQRGSLEASSESTIESARRRSALTVSTAPKDLRQRSKRPASDIASASAREASA